MFLEKKLLDGSALKTRLADVAGVDIEFKELSINIDPAELLVWILEVLFVFLVILATEHYILGEEVREPAYMVRILVAAALIVLILPIFGAIGQSLTIDDRNFYPLAVVIVYAITIVLLRFFTADTHFNSNVILTTVVLLVIYFVRVVFDIAII
ncbi:MAG: hypothetical protein ACFFGZ_11820 [Candidatus Thorarchaeota archaeon]